ncbi:unnamed protein product [Cuscuta epithymum]|uniref:Uncharacterized protein n=1 Tax=Cuscuta epithymum TaxID=186058 RepID=A0AAV0E493_9ASTE|nr:unnamed protein product [Cuscuta epithymum]
MVAAAAVVAIGGGGSKPWQQQFWLVVAHGEQGTLYYLITPALIKPHAATPVLHSIDQHLSFSTSTAGKPRAPLLGKSIATMELLFRTTYSGQPACVQKLVQYIPENVAVTKNMSTSSEKDLEVAPFSL